MLGLYEVQGVLGQGGMGRVYRVRHRGWGLDLAVKAPLPSVLEAAGGAGWGCEGHTARPAVNDGPSTACGGKRP